MRWSPPWRGSRAWPGRSSGSRPLAAEQGYRPETGALQAIAPRIDRLGDGRSAASLAREVLSFAGEGRP